MDPQYRLFGGKQAPLIFHQLKTRWGPTLSKLQHSRAKESLSCMATFSKSTEGLPSATERGFREIYQTCSLTAPKILNSIHKQAVLTLLLDVCIADAECLRLSAAFHIKENAVFV